MSAPCIHWEQMQPKCSHHGWNKHFKFCIVHFSLFAGKLISKVWSYSSSLILIRLIKTVCWLIDRLAREENRITAQVCGFTVWKDKTANVYRVSKKMVRCKMLQCPCHSSDSFLFPETKLMFPEKGHQQQYFPYKRFSERLKGAEI